MLILNFVLLSKYENIMQVDLVWFDYVDSINKWFEKYDINLSTYKNDIYID